MLDNFQEEAYRSYFGTSESGQKEDVQVNRVPQRERMTAKGNIDDLDKLGEILRKLLNAAWGSNWGVISPDTSLGDNAEDITVPQITYGINLREVAKGFSPKPVLTDTVEEVENGKKTGDSFRIYRQTFDCIVEFNFWESTSKDCRYLMNKFEEIMSIYSGYLKESGVSEIFFLKEVPSKYSLNYLAAKPMKCAYYFIRLERNKAIRVSQIKEIEMKLSQNDKSSPEKPSDDIYNKITYKL